VHFAQVNRNANKPESNGVQNTAFVDLGIGLFHAITHQGFNQRFPKEDARVEPGHDEKQGRIWANATLMRKLGLEGPYG
jgi:hypothetical protein